MTVAAVCAVPVVARSANPMPMLFDPRVMGALFLLLGVGAVARARKAISLGHCARAVDRAVAGGAVPLDDVVLAAVTLLDTEATSPFVRALAGEALRRARAVPLARVMPGPRWWMLAMAPLALGILAVTARARSTPPPAQEHAVAAASVQAPRIRVAAVALETERGEITDLLRSAEENGDAELARIARDLQRVMTGLTSPGGLNARTATARVDALAEEAAAVAKDAQAAELSERPAFSSTRTDDNNQATSVVGAFGESETTRESGAARRLQPNDHEAAAQGGTGTRPAGGDERRHLEELKRDPETQMANCRRDPAACRAGAQGRSLSELHRQAATADARQRLAEEARQLAERIRQGDGGSDALRRFARAARGTEGPGPQGQPADTVRGESAGHDGDTNEETMDGAGTPDDERNAVSTQTGQDGAPGEGRAESGAGIGTTPGGPVLGPRAPAPGRLAGRDTPARVANGESGPSRAQIIGGASAGGFATSAYRRVFEDYHAAVEESLDASAVPGERRFLVRRYFQLIRPRSPL